jgi:hypothetical protein
MGRATVVTAAESERERGGDPGCADDQNDDGDGAQGR